MHDAVHIILRHCAICFMPSSSEIQPRYLQGGFTQGMDGLLGVAGMIKSYEMDHPSFPA